MERRLTLKINSAKKTLFSIVKLQIYLLLTHLDAVKIDRWPLNDGDLRLEDQLKLGRQFLLVLALFMTCWIYGPAGYLAYSMNM